ncbi:MAG TPA: STAS domain-containing protein [Chitinispirillaceae bacterium]|nr:STAS domain-containing protein [Chitinispirillaceae bacterium]
MELQTSTHYDYNVIGFQGIINLSVLPSLTPQLTLFIQNNLDKNIVIDLTETTSIDSNTLRMLINIKKRFDSNNKQFFLLRPSQDILTLLKTTNLTKVMNVITKLSDIPPDADANIFEKYLPFTIQTDNLRQLRCSCAICGSSNVIGYLFDRSNFIWKWENSSYFPVCEDKEGNQFDFFSAQPIVCTECYMASIDPAQFNLLSETGDVIKHSVCDDKTKLLLSKAIKKRKKMMESDMIVGEHFFMFPRNRRSSYYAYLLTENCSRAASMNKDVFDPYMIGFMNYLTLQYADSNREELIDNCRTWLTQALNNSERYRAFELARIYYISMVATLMLGKLKELLKLYETFTSIMKTFPQEDISTDIDSPHFWYQKADAVWNKEIQQKSEIIAS